MVCVSGGETNRASVSIYTEKVNGSSPCEAASEALVVEYVVAHAVFVAQCTEAVDEHTRDDVGQNQPDPHLIRVHSQAYTVN